MTDDHTLPAADKLKSAEYDEADLVSSNAVRLSLKEWAIAAIFIVGLIVALPKSGARIGTSPLRRIIGSPSPTAMIIGCTTGSSRIPTTTNTP